GLSHPHRHSRRALSPRRRCRRHGARRRGETGGRARPASRGRQPRRRLRPRRHAGPHQESAPPLHAVPRAPRIALAINPSLYATAGFDPRKDLAPIGLIASMPVVLLAHPSFPAKTIGDVVAIAKTAGAKFNIGTSAVGTGGYLTAELFKSVTGIEAAIIPYKGTAQVMNDLLGNHVPIAFGLLRPALGNLQAGTLRAIAVRGPTRFSLLPDVPTADESGLSGFESVLHYGVLAPAGTPRPIIERLNAALRALAENAEVKQRIVAEGGDPLTSTPDDYAKDIDREETKWGTLVRKLNLKVE